MASSYMTKYLRISSYITKPFLIYEFATALLWISLYMKKILFVFLSVYREETSDQSGFLLKRLGRYEKKPD
jgi:hypothetical protein